MKVLVAAGAGFIGSHIVEQLHERADVRVLDNLTTGFRHNLAGLCRAEGDRAGPARDGGVFPPTGRMISAFSFPNFCFSP